MNIEIPQFLVPDQPFVVTEEPIMMLKAIIGGIDQRKRDRKIPQDLSELRSDAAQFSISKLYNDPYSTKYVRLGFDEPQSESGRRPGARQKVISMTGLLIIAQCKLAARGAEMESLVRRRFASMIAMPNSVSSVDKQVEKWQKQRCLLPIFESAAATREAVLCILRINLGQRMGNISEVKKQLLGMRGKVLAQGLTQERDFMTRAALMSVVDFEHHSEDQIKKTVSAIRKSKMSYGKASEKYMKSIWEIMDVSDDVFGDAFLDFFKAS